MATYTYLEYRTRPWNKGRVVFRMNVTGKDKRYVQEMGRQADKQWPPETHHSCLVTEKGTDVPLYEVNVHELRNRTTA